MGKKKPKWDWATLAPQFFKVALSKLNPYERNARVNTEAIPYVKKSIKAYGMLVPIVLDDKDALTIVAGHTRLAAMIDLCKEEGRDISRVTTTCILAEHLTSAQIRQFRLVDNKVAEFSQWDEFLLDKELNDLNNDGWDATQFGFVEQGDEEDDEDKEEKPPEVTIKFKTEAAIQRFIDEMRFRIEEYGGKIKTRKYAG